LLGDSAAILLDAIPGAVQAERDVEVKMPLDFELQRGDRVVAT
jgi:hypothetical protein